MVIKRIKSGLCDATANVLVYSAMAKRRIRTIADLQRALDLANRRSARLYGRPYVLGPALTRNLARFDALQTIDDAAVRVIVDPVHWAIPPAALRGMAPDGRTDIWTVLRDLMACPSQLPLLVRLAVDAFAARTEMLRVRHLLGPHFGLVDFVSSDREMAPDDALPSVRF